MEKEKEINNIINSLDGIQKANPGDFFFTRVQARLQKEEISAWSRVAYFITKPTVALATLSLICLLNAGALFYQHAESSSTTAMADQADQNTAEDYNTTVAANSYYDENPDPR